MNDSIDMKLYQYFENVSIPNELDKVIEQAIPKKKQRKSYKYNQYLARVASIFVICILAGGIVFAKDIANYVTELFAHTHQGVVKALENGYVANIDMDYAYSKDTGIKVDSIVMDDFNLLITFTLKLEENIDSITHLEITDLLVTDENKNIVFCNYDNVKVYEDYCKKNNIPYSKKNMRNNYTDGGYATEIIKKENNEITFTYKMYSRGYPKSKQLNINFKNIALKEKVLEPATITKDGIWKIQIELPQEFYNRDIAYYQVKDGSDKENNIEITNAIVSNTETKIEFNSVTDSFSKIEGSSMEEIIENKMNALLNGEGNFYDEIEIENEEGKVFKRTQTNDLGGITYSMDGSIRGSATFTMTKYDMTDTIKLRIIRDEEVIVINLTRK